MIAVPESKAAESTSLQPLITKTYRETKFQLTVVLGPERKVPSPDNILKEETNYCPWHVIDRRSWREQSGSTKYNARRGEIVVFGKEFELTESCRQRCSAQLRS